jgi:hypothetical protein
VRAAERSAREERRHARVMTRLARNHGAPVPALRVRAARARSLEAFARENAIEGCVKETYGAALALHQAQHAHDPNVRAAMQRIAFDEARHAELAWQIDAWVAPRLHSRARIRVARERARAARRLHEREVASRDDILARHLGMPAHALRCTVAGALAEACSA